MKILYLIILLEIISIESRLEACFISNYYNQEYALCQGTYNKVNASDQCALNGYQFSENALISNSTVLKLMSKTFG